MSEDLHRQEKKRIVERLKLAGWDMAEGAVTLDRAALVYDNGQITIEVEQDYDRHELLLTLASPDGREITVYPVYGDSLEATLDAIVSFQDRVTAENFQDILRELVVTCPEVYIQEDEDDEPRLLTSE